MPIESGDKEKGQPLIKVNLQKTGGGIKRWCSLNWDGDYPRIFLNLNHLISDFQLPRFVNVSNMTN